MACGGGDCGDGGEGRARLSPQTAYATNPDDLVAPPKCDRVGASGACELFGDAMPLASYEIYNPGLGFAPTLSCPH